VIARAVKGNIAMSWRAVASPRLVLLLTFGGTSVVNYAFSLAMGRLLLPGDFGLLAFAQVLMLIVSLVLSSGITWSLATMTVGVAGPQRAALVRGALVSNLGMAVLVDLAIVALFALGPLRPGLETPAVTAIVALTLLCVSVINTAVAAMQGAERFGSVAAIQGLEILCKAVAGTTFVLLGYGVAGAIAGFLVGAIVGVLLGLYQVVRVLGVRLWGAVSLPSPHMVGPMFGALLGLALLQNLDLAVVKLFSGGARTLTGYYQAATILATAPYYLVSSALIPVLLTQLARLDTVASTRERVSALLRLVAVLVVPIEAILALAPAAVLHLLFPVEYAPAAPTLRVLALGNGALMLLVILATSFQAVGRAWASARALLGITAVEVVLLWAVVPVWHNDGAAGIFAVAATAALIILGMVYVRALGRHWRRRTALWLARYAAAVTVGVVGGAALYGVYRNSTLAIAVGGLCYLAAVLLLRLIDRPSLPIQSIGGKKGGPIDSPSGVPFDWRNVDDSIERAHGLAHSAHSWMEGTLYTGSADAAPRVSIIIPSWIGHVDRLLQSIERQTFHDYEVHVVRGTSPAARARNNGVRETKGDILLFVDDDAYLGHDHVLEVLVDLLDDSPRAAVVGTSKLVPDTASRLQRAIARQVPRMIYPVVPQTLVSNPPLDSYGFTAITTTCCAVRRDAFDEVDGFDEDLITGPEDVDFFHRVFSCGHDIVVAANCWVYHDPPPSVRDLLRKSFWYGMGHALMVREDRKRNISLLALDRWYGKGWLVVATLAFPFAFFVHYYFDPTPKLVVGFRPLKALSTYAVLCGYVYGWYRGKPRKPATTYRGMPSGL